MKNIQTISIKCDNEKTLELAEMTEMQGGLKERTDIDYDKIKLSIIKYGFSFPFYIWKSGKTNYILDGHGRFETLCRMQKDGYLIPPLPVFYIKAKDKAEAKQKLLRLNSTYGKMTKESVLEFAEDLEINFDEISLPDTTIDFSDQSEETPETEGDDEVPEVEEKAVSKRGEMYELGNSLLMCGDSTNAEDVARLMGGEKADMVVTDPPYNVDYQGKTKSKMKIENDKMCDDNFRLFLVDAFTTMKDAMKDGASFYIWYASVQVYNFQGACDDVGLQVRQELCWNKNSLVLSRQDYQWKHEPCLYGWKDGASHNWYGDRKQTTVIDCKRPTASRLHPTMKPVELFEYLIKNSSKEGDVVLDLFGGSGTTLIASEKTNRKGRLMELDPHYCDVIRKRYTQWCKENGRPLSSGCLE